MLKKSNSRNCGTLLNLYNQYHCKNIYIFIVVNTSTVFSFFPLPRWFLSLVYKTLPNMTSFLALDLKEQILETISNEV